MKLKTSHLIWGGIALIALSQGENVRQSLAKGNQVRQDQAEFSDRIRLNRTEARQAAKLSKVAIDRYRNNCILVVDAQTRQPIYFTPGEAVVEPKLNRALRPGAFVCNTLGDTGVVNAEGNLTDVARVATPEIPQFKKLLEQKR
ncbi:hypothetical protein H6F96_19640 [Microcoleus sp. FACHB-53]|nr:hypothetical protein [Microcoleus sp. FACHB-53]